MASVVPEFQVADRANPGRQAPAANPVQQAPQAQAQPYVDPRAVFGQPQAPAPQPEMVFWGLMQDLQPAGLPLDAMGPEMLPWSAGGLHDHYRQSENPEASPAGNGRIGDANEIDHRTRVPAMEEAAINDNMGLWDFAARRDDFGNLAMNVGNMEQRFNEMARWQYPRMDDGLGENDGAGFYFGPAQFGLDDLVFK